MGTIIKVAPVVALVAMLAGGATTVASAQSPGAPTISGSWVLRETTGDLPDQAVRALDGSAVATAAIEIEQAEGSVTVRRTSPQAAPLRVMLLQTGGPDPASGHDAPLTARAQWQDRSLVARGEVSVKHGFLKRRVPYEEEWRPDQENRTLTVTLTLKTPLGAKRRTQVFVRDAPRQEKNLATK